MINYEMPEVLTRIPELKKAYEIIVSEVQRLIETAINLEKELSTDTATDEGLKRRESILNIGHRDTDTISQRKKRIELYERPIGYYSFGEINEYIKAVAGERSFIERPAQDDKLFRTRLTVADVVNEKELKELEKRIKQMLPVPMTLLTIKVSEDEE